MNENHKVVMKKVDLSQKKKVTLNLKVQRIVEKNQTMKKIGKNRKNQ